MAALADRSTWSRKQCPSLSSRKRSAARSSSVTWGELPVEVVQKAGIDIDKPLDMLHGRLLGDLQLHGRQGSPHLRPGARDPARRGGARGVVFPNSSARVLPDTSGAAAPAPNAIHPTSPSFSRSQFASTIKNGEDPSGPPRSSRTAGRLAASGLANPTRTRAFVSFRLIPLRLRCLTHLGFVLGSF